MEKGVAETMRGYACSNCGAEPEYYVSTVGKNANETVIAKYVQEQGQEKEYKKLYGQQLGWFE